MIDLAGRRILVTGAGGLVGHAAAQALVRLGADVLAVGQGADVPGRALALDLAGAEWPAAGCDAIVHCAARLPARFEGPEADAADRENQAIDQRALDAAASQRAHLVYLSSGSVYGDTGGLIGDDTPVRPLLGYARQKLATEAAITRRELSATVLRLVAPYGPRQQRRTVLRTFLDLALAGQPLRYHGSGARTQDFLHVGDVAEAVVRAIVGRARGCFVLASGVPVTMRALAELVVEVTGSASVVEASGLPDADEARQARYDVSRLRAELGLHPARPLATGLAEWAAVRAGARA